MKESKFTKIIKWAKENSYDVTDKITKYTKTRQVIIKVDNKEFVIENRESTIYYSIHGMKGNPAGIRLETRIIDEGRYRRPFWNIYKNQTDVIRDMEYELRK